MATQVADLDMFVEGEGTRRAGIAKLSPNSGTGLFFPGTPGAGPGSLVHEMCGHRGSTLAPYVLCGKPAGRRCDKMTSGRMATQEWRGGRPGPSRMTHHNGDTRLPLGVTARGRIQGCGFAV